MPIVYVPEENHVVRYVSWARLRKDENDNVIGVLGAAFRLREDEEFLSSTWAEFHKQPTREENIHAAINTIRASKLEVKPKSGFAIGLVADIKAACLARPKNHKIRVIHESEDDNKAHTALRGWPRDDEDLLNLLAEEPWAEHRLNSAVP